jgi:acyl transferase domain-containing protein/NADPH:quinone reductase-like Zn-dependent oxidoreductase
MTRGPLERKTMKEEIDTTVSERLFVLSAHDKTSAEKTMQSLGVYLEQRPEVFQNDLLSNLAYTLGQRRSFHPWRIAVTASTSAELVEMLSNGKVAPCKQDVEALRMGWIFTGQGAQWWAMGRELYQQYPVYASAIELADAHLISIGAKFSLLQELAKEEDTTQINAAYLSQPACTAVQLALVNLLRSWGLQPAAVVGHSSGEIGAAYAAGFITFEDTMTIAYHRGRLVPILKKMYPSLNGCMMAVGASKDQVAPLLDRICPSLGQAKIACINSPASITISGDEPAVTELQTLLEAAYPEMFARKLQVDTAYHSHHMDLVAKQYMEALQGLKAPEPSAVRFYSSLLGRLVGSEDLDRTYWVQNLTCPVRFDEALQGMCQPLNEHKTGVNMLCELGPHAALQGPVKQTLKHIGGAAIKIPYTSALARKKNAVTTTLAMAGTLFVKGAALDMGAINFPTQDKKPQVLVDMPRYNWNHSSKFLHESRFTKVHKYHDAPRHDIIGVLAPYSNDTEPTWRNVVRLDDLPWLRQYQMQGVTMFPIAGFLAMAIEAVAQKAIIHKTPWDDIEVEDLVVRSPIMLSEEELEMTIILKKHGEGTDSEATHSFLIQSWSQTKGWSDNCTGTVSLLSTSDNEVDGRRARKYKRQDLYSKSVDISQAATECTSASQMYTQLSKIGVVYGELFQGLEQCHASVDGAVAQIIKTDTTNEMPHHYETDYILHPAFMEQLVSLYWPIIAAAGETNTVHLPASIGRVTVSARALSEQQKPGFALHALCEARATVSNNASNSYDMVALDSAGEPLITIEDLSTSPIVEHGSGAEQSAPQELCYKLDWEPVVEGEGANGPAQHGFDADVVIIHGETELQHDLAAAITQHLKTTHGAKITQGTLQETAHLAQGKLCLVLTELDRPLLTTLDAAQFEALKVLLTTVQGAMWVVQGAYHNSTNPEANMVSGFSRTLRSEGTLANFVTLDFDPQHGSHAHEFVEPIARVLHMTLGATKKVEEKEFRAQGGKLFTPRVLDDGEMNAFVHEQVHPSPAEPARFIDTDRPLRASLGTPGALETLIFEDDSSLRQDLPESCVDIAVKAVGIGPTDLANGARLGMECTGTINAVGSMVPHLRVGDRVAAIVPTGCLSNVARVQSKFVFKFPAHMSFEALATMPVAYCTAVYALTTQARLVEGESVLIHDAASAVGQAALTLAWTIGASVWATVKTAAEKDMLMQLYSIPQDRIWFSGAIHFAERIQSVTKGAGVDVVFNTLTDYRVLRATWASIAQFGRFVNVVGGQRATLHVPSTTSATVYTVDFAALAAQRPSVAQRALSVVARMVQDRQLHPLLNVASYDAAGIVAALQSVAAPHSNGRSVIVFKDSDYVTVSPPPPSSPHHLLTYFPGPTHPKTPDTPPQRRNLHPHRRHRRPRAQHGRLDGLQRGSSPRPALPKRHRTRLRIERSRRPTSYRGERPRPQLRRFQPHRRRGPRSRRLGFAPAHTGCNPRRHGARRRAVRVHDALPIHLCNH